MGGGAIDGWMDRLIDMYVHGWFNQYFQVRWGAVVGGVGALETTALTTTHATILQFINPPIHPSIRRPKIHSPIHPSIFRPQIHPSIHPSIQVNTKTKTNTANQQFKDLRARLGIDGHSQPTNQQLTPPTTLQPINAPNHTETPKQNKTKRKTNSAN